MKRFKQLSRYEGYQIKRANRWQGAADYFSSVCHALQKAQLKAKLGAVQCEGMHIEERPRLSYSGGITPKDGIAANVSPIKETYDIYQQGPMEVSPPVLNLCQCSVWRRSAIRLHDAHVSRST